MVVSKQESTFSKTTLVGVLFTGAVTPISVAPYTHAIVAGVSLQPSN